MLMAAPAMIVDVDLTDSDNDKTVIVDDKEVVEVDGEDSVKLHDFMEFYSPPRIAPECIVLGLLELFSFDVTTSGHDFLTFCARAMGLRLLAHYQPLMIMLSPPCTMFSVLTWLWNLKKMTESQYQARMKEARCHIEYSMQLAMMQYNASRYFAFEQPGQASSWDLECVKRVAALPGVVKVPFDMCMFGKTTPFNKQPIKKRTIIMTNSALLAKSLEGHRCDGNHLHIACHGAEHGVKLCEWCQVYPLKLCEKIAFVVASLTR